MFGIVDNAKHMYKDPNKQKYSIKYISRIYYHKSISNVNTFLILLARHKWQCYNEEY